tara:strand:+ start:1217 stop:1837 length:621 start_codon:yes stop_codon:yes gene_type:complete
MKFNSRLIIAISLFLFGLYFCLNYKSSDLLENFQGIGDCPNLLVKKGKELHLVNTKKAIIPGVNPIKFNNLEEYVEYVNWSKKVGITCPILYYEQTYNTQNERGYRLLNDPLNPNAGLSSNLAPQKAQSRLLIDANRDDPPYNQNNFAGMDVEDQRVGIKTPLDNINLQTNEGSLNPMDSNWCGINCVNEAVNDGKFKDRTRPKIN